MAGTWIELDLGILRSNIRSLQRVVKARTEIIVSLKSDAFGHGTRLVCQAAWDGGAKLFIVDSFEDGCAVRDQLPDARILLDGPLNPPDVVSAAEARLIPIVFNKRTAQELAAAAAGHLTALECHVAVRTADGWRGFDWEQDVDCVAQLTRTRGIRITGFASRFDMAQDPDTTFAEVQLARFYKAVNQCSGARSRSMFRHMADAAAMLRQPLWDMDGVRPGLLAYGYAPELTGPARDVKVEPCMSWKTRLAQVRRVKGGRATGCGNVFAPTGGMWLGDVSAGFADGYRRVRSEPGHVLVGGRAYPLLGPVGLNSFAVDLGAECQVAPGDEVVLLGAQGAESVRADDLARWCGTLPEDVLSSIRTTDRRSVRGRLR